MNWYNFFVGVGFIFLLFCYVPIKINKTPSPESKFIDFMQRFNKTYNTKATYEDGYAAFQESTDAIHKLNSNRSRSSALYGLTKFSDMTPDEFKERFLQPMLPQRISKRRSRTFDKDSSEESHDQKRRRNHHRRNKRAALVNIPLKVDWRQSGIVTKINNQKSCGACWAFSTIENMESMYALKNKKLISLSIQQAIDCAGYENDGCNGGDDCTFLQWLQDFNIRVYTEEAYPLHLKNEECKLSNNSFFVQVERYACDNFVNAEEYILQAIAAIGPVGVAVNAISWQHYVGGIIQFNCGGAFGLLNHSVQLVGYDLTADIPYYIARNSWGEDFGDNGYLYLAIGDNLCGLANEVSALTVL